MTMMIMIMIIMMMIMMITITVRGYIYISHPVALVSYSTIESVAKAHSDGNRSEGISHYSTKVNMV